MADGNLITITMPEYIMGEEFPLFITKEIIEEFATFTEIGATGVAMYMK